MARLLAAGRFVAFGLFLSRSDSARKGEGVGQKQLSEFLHLLRLLWCEFFLFLVSCFVPFVTQKVGPLCHRGCKHLLISQRLDAGFEPLLFEIFTVRTNRSGGCQCTQPL